MFLLSPMLLRVVAGRDYECSCPPRLIAVEDDEVSALAAGPVLVREPAFQRLTFVQVNRAPAVGGVGSHELSVSWDELFTLLARLLYRYSVAVIPEPLDVLDVARPDARELYLELAALVAEEHRAARIVWLTLAVRALPVSAVKAQPAGGIGRGGRCRRRGIRLAGGLVCRLASGPISRICVGVCAVAGLRDAREGSREQ